MAFDFVIRDRLQEIKLTVANVQRELIRNLTDPGQLQPLAVPDEQIDAELALQLRDLAREGGLGQIETLGRLIQGGQFNDGSERFQQIEHRTSSLTSRNKQIGFQINEFDMHKSY